MDLQQELSLFLQGKHRRRASTMETYQAILGQFVSSVHDRNIVVAVSDFLNSKELKPATYNLYLSAITSFLFERRLILREDRDELYRGRVSISQPAYSEHALSPTDVLRFFTFLQQENARTNPLRQQRDLCIFALQYACAMRISEVLTLSPEDMVDTETSIMVTVRAIHSKTGVERTLPLPHRFRIGEINVAAELKAWKYLRGLIVDHVHTSLVFFTVRKNSFGKAIAVRRMIQKYNTIKRRLRIESGRSTHALRHTRITELARNPGIPIAVISEFAGHHSKGQPNIRTTSFYVQRACADEIEKFL